MLPDDSAGNAGGILVNMTDDDVLIPAGTILGCLGADSKRQHFSAEEAAHGQTHSGTPIMVVDWHEKMTAHMGPCGSDGNAPYIPVLFGEPQAKPTSLIKLLKEFHDAKTEVEGRYGLKGFKVGGAWPNWTIELGKQGPVGFTLDVATLVSKKTCMMQHKSSKPCMNQHMSSTKGNLRHHGYQK